MMVPCGDAAAKKVADMGPEPMSVFPSNWRHVLDEMQHEWDRLHQELAQLRSERNQLAKALVVLLGDDPAVNGEEILAQIGREKPIRELLCELRSQLVER